jgi:hypothetical protein
MKSILQEFVQAVARGHIEIYNEFSLQHEFGIHLRGKFPGLKVHFERNVSALFGTTSQFIKREIDISVFSADKAHKHSVLELKFPRNGQHPEQMFKFCQDICFAEQLKQEGFQNAYFLALVDDKLFYDGPDRTGIYSYFRDGKTLTGTISKPTGSKDKSVTIRGQYQVNWKPVGNGMMYAFVEI